jgi:hypothetical protein
MPGALGAFALNRSASETFIVNGGISLTGNGTSGTVEITLRGGTWVGSNGLGNNLILDGNITISGTVAFTAQSIKYLSGTITTTGTTLNFSGTNNRTIDTNGVTWNNVSFLGNGTYTVGSNFLCTGLFTVGVLGAFTFNRTSSSIFRTNGGMSVSTTCSGTAEITLGGGTWSGTAIVTNNLIIDGNVTIAASSGNYTTGTISGTSGTVTGTLNAIGACTFNCVGVNWGTISFAAAATYTVNSLLTASVIQPNISGVTFAGTSGWTCGTLLNASTSSATISLKDGNTYTINNLFNCYQSRIGSPVLFTSSHATNVAYLVMPNNGNNICNVLASFTRINASGGRTINTFGGTITSCVNVNQYYDYRPVAI